MHEVDVRCAVCGALQKKAELTGTSQPDEVEVDEAVRLAEELEDGSRDPDELDGEPAWSDEGSDDET